MNQEIQRLIYGKTPLEKIVSAGIHDSVCELFIQQPDGSVKSVFKPNKYWLLSHKKLDSQFKQLQGDQFYQFCKLYEDRGQFLSDRNKYYRNGTFSIWNELEAAEVMYGFTYFKGMKPDEVTTLSFDIETTTLEHNEKSKVLVIGNTLRKAGTITRKLFCYDQYSTQRELIDDWCKWVREVDPSVLIGHNVVIFDLPYLNFITQREGGQLELGRDSSMIHVDDRESKLRKDGSQSYTYHKIQIYGREICDTFFLSLKWDTGRNLENYKLKNIVTQLGLEIPNRQFYDAEKIKDNYQNPIEWKKIQEYCKFDSDDALNIYDEMIPAFFYIAQSVPKPFTEIIQSASGSQINAMMIRGYLQEGYSLPLDSETKDFEGGISFGRPGLYKNCWKIDIKSCYPSAIVINKLYSKLKDPHGNMLKLCQFFMDKRFEYKALVKETKDPYYTALDQSAKIFINSIFGFCSAPGLLFNDPITAAKITEYGREYLNLGAKWATGKNLEYWKNGD